MATHLEVGSRNKLLISPPRINLRRTGSYNYLDKGPVSSTSSRFNFNHLVFSPPPSPGLPSLSPPPRKPPRSLSGHLRRPTRQTRLLFRVIALVLVIWGAVSLYRRAQDLSPLIDHDRWRPSPSPLEQGGEDQYEMVEQDNLPDFPTPVIVTDRRGRAKWTVSIPPSHDFPLSMGQYAEMSAECREVAGRVRAWGTHSQGQQQQQTYPSAGNGLGSPDRNFIDVGEAEKAGYLPGLSAAKSRKPAKLGHQGNLVGQSTTSPEQQQQQQRDAEKPVCERSMTFVLEAADAGIGTMLMMLWTAHGLAKQERRAFFIDDSRWAYGRYTDIFEAPPVPACRPPARHEMVPCPRQARHLVVSAATAPDVFGSLITGFDSDGVITSGGGGGSGSGSGSGSNNEAFASTTMTTAMSTAMAPDRARQRTMFDLARVGYEALFRLTRDDANYVDTRVRDLMARRIVPKTKGKQNGVAVGVHVRRGDRRPLEFQYRDSYVPMTTFGDAARALVEDRLRSDSSSNNNNNNNNHHHHSGLHAGGGGSSSSIGSSSSSSSSNSRLDAAREHSFVVAASDDPLVYDNSRGELSFAGGGAMSPAQERIRLASKHDIQQAQPDRHMMHKFVDEAFGWEGGFFAAMFWNLGSSWPAAAGPSPTAAKTDREQEDGRGGGGGGGRGVAAAPSEETLRLRSLMARAYVMDLAVLADAADAVVCTVSAAGCRLLAVMMGWESAMDKKNWVNVDGAYGWRGITY